MKMSRKRAQELRDAEFPGPYVFGPSSTLKKFFTEGQPTTLVECGFLEDASEWVYEGILIEPDWTIDYSESRLYGTGWYVYNAAAPDIAWLSGTIWKTRERAEAYLTLWKEDWWDGP